jgi:lipopolysaccharide/colanic/teichoic acid biosynthesis glycosyltransferase
MYRRGLKRVLDVLVAVAALLLLSPVLLAIAAVVRRRLGTPVLFTQARPGLDGRLFQIVKFRTMRNEVGADGRPLTDAARMTRLGSFLRSTSLDELPELWNVITGDMSLVGPRPLLTAYLTRYTPAQAHRHDVRPGITGLAQVRGRNALTWEEKFTLDLEYVEHCSLLLDMKILLRTAWQVVVRRGVNHPGHVTMHEFVGSALP